MDWDEVLSILDHYRSMDLQHGGGRILGSMYTTPDPLAVEAYSMFMESNLGNPCLFPGTVAMSFELRAFLLDLLSARGEEDILFPSGGTESNLTALWMAREITGKRTVIYCENAHFSVPKAIHVLGMEGMEIAMDQEYRMDLACLEKEINDDVAAVVATAGTTGLGMVDPIEEIGGLIRDHNAFFHVDAAFGGFILPLLGQYSPTGKTSFAFNVDGVDTVTVDPHKFFGSTTPLGALGFRREEWAERISFKAPYLSSQGCTGLLGTRNSASVASAFALIKHHGFDGLSAKVRNCMKRTDHLVKRLEEEDIPMVCEPVINIVGIPVSDPGAAAGSLMDKGWYPSIIRKPSALRVLVMPHLDTKLIDDFIRDLGEVL